MYFDHVLFQICDVRCGDAPGTRLRAEVMECHKNLDGIYEDMRDLKLGTTNRGIGPCYCTKTIRNGVRTGCVHVKRYYTALIWRSVGAIRLHSSVLPKCCEAVWHLVTRVAPLRPCSGGTIAPLSYCTSGFALHVEARKRTSLARWGARARPRGAHR